MFNITIYKYAMAYEVAKFIINYILIYPFNILFRKKCVYLCN